MKIVAPSIKLLWITEEPEKMIELSGRTCYKSEDKITDESAGKFVKMLTNSGHHAMIEHAVASFRIITDRGICYSEDTEILTQDGWKFFTEVTDKDLFLTKDDYGNLLYLPPTKIVVKKYKGDMLLFENTELSLLVTPNHNMWVFDYNKRSPLTKVWKFLRADEMNNGAYEFDVSGKWSGKSVGEISIPPTTVPRGIYTKEYDGRLFDSKLFLELLGLWVTDGSISPKGKDSGRRITITITQTKSQVKERIEYLLGALNLEYSKFKNDYRITCLPLWFKLKEWFIKGEDYKKSTYIAIPKWIKELNIVLLGSFLEGVILGDGGKYDSGTMIYSSSPAFCKDLVEIALKVGKCASIRESRPEGHTKKWANGRESVCKAAYVVNIKDKTYIHLDSRGGENSIGKKCPYDGMVYCAELPKYHKLFVMRNGKAAWCGNTHEIVRHRLASYAQESTRYCVAGGTSLTMKNPHQKYTVAELFQNKASSPNGAWKRLNIRQMDEETGELIYTTIKDIILAGIEPTVVITTKLGYSLTLTPDHEVRCENGYTEAKDLLGRQIAINGTKLAYRNRDWLFHQYNTLMKTAVQIASENNWSSEVVKKWVHKHNLPEKPKSYWNLGRETWNKGLTKETDPRMAQLAESRKAYTEGLTSKTCMKAVRESCEICGSMHNLNVHHINEDRENNDLGNLMTLCISCHQGIHARSLSVTYFDEVVSIRPGPTVEVYDLVVGEPNYNFIANGIVVHNCNYSKDKFGNECTFIQPSGLSYLQTIKWKVACENAEYSYFIMLKAGCTPQIARSVLPNCLKTEIVMMANLREHRHFIKLRGSKAAHPQIRPIAYKMWEILMCFAPNVFGDLSPLKE